MVGMEVRDDDHLDGVDLEPATSQVRQGGGRRFHQHRFVHHEAVPVAPRGGQEIAGPQEGELGHDVSTRARKEATRSGSPSTTQSATGRRRYSISTRSDAVALTSACLLPGPAPATRQLPPGVGGPERHGAWHCVGRGPEHDLEELGHPVVRHVAAERVRRRRDGFGVPGVYRDLLHLVSSHRSRRRRLSPPGPARRGRAPPPPARRTRDAVAWRNQPARTSSGGGVTSPGHGPSGLPARTFSAQKRCTWPTWWARSRTLHSGVLGTFASSPSAPRRSTVPTKRVLASRIASKAQARRSAAVPRPSAAVIRTRPLGRGTFSPNCKRDR